MKTVFLVVELLFYLSIIIYAVWAKPSFAWLRVMTVLLSVRILINTIQEWILR